MKTPTFLLSLALGSALLVGCDSSKPNAESEALKKKVEELEAQQREREREEIARKQAATEEELARARTELQRALEALEQEKAKPAPKTVPEVNVEDAGKAVVVSEPREPGVRDPRIGTEVTEVVPGALPAIPVEGADYRVFFNELASQGEWFETSDYGYVWQPREVREQPGWRPYTRGQWVHSENGWTWASDENFGWATFHYGRWTLLEKHGWAWIPGDEWAPAWVSWRQSNDYIGWAPLPPETLYNENHAYDGTVDTVYDLAPSWYAFVPVRNFQGPVAAHCVPNESVMQIVVHTENVTRITTRKEGIYCGGPNVDWVSRRFGGQVRQCSVQRHGERMAGGAHQHLRGNKLEVFAPSVRAPWNSAVRPQRVSGNWGRVSTVRGGGVMNRGVLERFRAEMLARHEAARRAMEREEVRQALIRDRLAREEAARQAASRCQADVHGGLEQDLKEAGAEFDLAQALLAKGGLSPRQRTLAEIAVKKSEQKYLKAEAAYVEHMKRFHAEEWLRIAAQRAKEEAARRAREEELRRTVCRPSEHEQLENAYTAALREVRGAEQAIAKGDLNPRQLAYAKLMLKNATKKLATAETSYMAHMKQYHRDDHRQMLADRDRRERDLAERAAEERRQVEALARAEAERLAAMKAESERRARMEAEAEAERLAKLEAERRAEEERRRRMVCNVDEHRQLEAAWTKAGQEFQAANARLQSGLNPKQFAYAKKAVGNAAKNLKSAEMAYLAHLQKHHPEDHRKFVADRARANAAEADSQRRREADARAQEEAKRAAMERQRLADGRAKAEADRIAAERAKADARAAAMEQQRLAQERAKAEADRIAAERAKSDARAAAMEQQRLAEEKAKLEAQRLAAERAKADAQRAAMEERRRAEQSARMEAERQAAALAKAEAQRIAAEKLKQKELGRMAAERAAAALAAQKEAQAKAQAEAAAKAQAEAERLARERAARQTPTACQPAEHKQLEAAYRTAKAAVDAANKKLQGGNPKQAAYARKALGDATKKLIAAQAGYEAHMKQHHAAEWKAIEAARASAGRKAKESRERGRGPGRKR